jgi:hypothetical protein
MPSYPKLASLVANLTPANSSRVFAKDVIPYLVDEWIHDYERTVRQSDLVETTSSDFFYLFDIRPGRLVAAWGISHGRHGAPRDASRMRGHPLSAGSHYHRGHAVPHTLGGGTDINLVTQLGSLNIGAFRALEREAVATPGSLYFTYWVYDQPYQQQPISVEQGLLCPGRAPDVRTHSNRLKVGA